MGRKFGNKAFSDADRIILLDVLTQLLPVDKDEWIHVQTKFMEAQKKAIQEVNEKIREDTGEEGQEKPVWRTGDSLRNLFKRMKKTEGNALTDRANQVETLILNKFRGNLLNQEQGEEDEEDEEGEEDEEDEEEEDEIDEFGGNHFRTIDEVGWYGHRGPPPARRLTNREIQTQGDVKALGAMVNTLTSIINSSERKAANTKNKFEEQMKKIQQKNDQLVKEAAERKYKLEVMEKTNALLKKKNDALTKTLKERDSKLEDIEDMLTAVRAMVKEEQESSKRQRTQ